MADVNTEPKLSRKRKLAKNKKKSWRASNIEDVEEFLDDERRQIRTGGLVSEKTDESLFVLDKVAHQGNDLAPKRKRISKDKALRCLSHLQPDPHSKSVRKPDQSNFQKGRRTQRILDRLHEKTKTQTQQAAQQQRKQYNEAKKLERERKKQLPVVEGDLWSDEAGDDHSGSKVKPPKKYFKKPSALPATKIPHPGASVNPSYEDHQDLLNEALEIELSKAKKERKLHNALEAKFPSKDDAPNANTYMVEMSAGLFDDSDEDEDSSDEDTPLSCNPPVRREDRKTKKQKRIEKEEGVKTKEKTKENEVKRRENMILRIPTLKAEINKKERKIAERAALKKRQKEQQKFLTRRLGKTKYEEQEPDLKLSDELVGSLREVKPEGHLLQDIYKSMQRRNIVEPRVRQKNKRKYKPKTFEKKGHKAVML